MRIYLIGFMGAGKSYWGPLLAQQAGVRFYDLDREIEESQGMDIDEIFSKKSRFFLSGLSNSCTYQRRQINWGLVFFWGISFLLAFPFFSTIPTWKR